MTNNNWTDEVNDKKKPNVDWTQETLQKLAFEGLIESRRARRWRVFLRIVFLIWLFLILWAIFFSGSDSEHSSSGPHTALIKIDGKIDAGGRNNADTIIYGLKKAFKDKETKGVIIRLNSPGGSPVQSDYIYEEILQLRKAHPDVKVYAVCSDICASGAYYIASAANDIYANRASMVGSIGVIYSGFGFVDAINKIGVSRRVYVAGNKKDWMDPFAPSNPKAVAQLKEMLASVHGLFIHQVERGRGNRIDDNNKELFSGRIWVGPEAKSLGLSDGFATPQQVATHIVKAKKIVDFTPRRTAFERIANSLGTSFTGGLMKELNLTQLG